MRQAAGVELSEVLRRRRMVRRYDPDRPVSAGALQRVLGAALRAPSAGFSQGLDLLVLTGADERRRFWVSQAGSAAVAEPDPWLAGMSAAPVVVAVLCSPAVYLARYAEPDKRSQGRRPGAGGPDWRVPYWDVDAGMAAVLMLLAAVDDDLGACFFGLVEPDGPRRLAAEFGVPDGVRCIGAITLGHPAPGVPPAGSARRRRRTLSEVAHDGRYGRAWPMVDGGAGTGPSSGDGQAQEREQAEADARDEQPSPRGQGGPGAR